jgi:hypothetical protein
MDSDVRLRDWELHKAFVSSMGDHVREASDLAGKPLELELLPPLPRRVRLYLFNLTHPPGGRTMGEHKIQLMVPGQPRGSHASFDHSSGAIVILAGHDAGLDVYVLWDAGLYPKFAFSRNIQVKAQTVYSAFAGNIAFQERRVRGQGVETVVAAPANRLPEAIGLRLKLTQKRLMGPE